MEGQTKRQWMQSFNGRIRVGPKYQAMIPPFCRPDPAEKATNEMESTSKSLGVGQQYPSRGCNPMVEKPTTIDVSDFYIDEYEVDNVDIMKHLHIPLDVCPTSACNQKAP